MRPIDFDTVAGEDLAGGSIAGTLSASSAKRDYLSVDPGLERAGVAVSRSERINSDG